MFILKQGQTMQTAPEELKTKSINTIVLVSILMCLSGCVGLKYTPSEYQAPPSFMYDDFQQHSPYSLTQWWKQFNDPLLERLLCDACTSNYSLAIAIEKIEQARERYNITNAGLLPQINIGGRASKSQFSRNLLQTDFISEGNRRLSLFEVAFDARWEIDLWGKIWRARSARIFEFKAEIENMRDIYIILLADVARTYIRIKGLSRKRDVLQQLYAIQKDITHLVYDLWKAGLDSQIEYTRQSQIEQSLFNQVKDIDTLVKQSYNQLAFLLSKAPSDISVDINHTLDVPLNPIDIRTPSDVLRRRPDIRRAEMIVGSAFELTEQAKAEWFPTIDLFGTLGLTSTIASLIFDNESSIWTFGSSFLAPVINFGRIQSRVRERQSQQRQARLDYCQTVVNAFKDVENFLIAYSNNREQYHVLKDQRDSALQEERLITDTFKSGLQSKLAMLVARKNRLIKDIDLIDITQALNINLISLYKALGGGW
jgi:NodT family efflux transporter outer membrane factor (OMF) lipoprotein